MLDDTQDVLEFLSPHKIKVYTSQDYFDSSVLRELRTIINAAYRSHDINPPGEIGERIQYDTQIVSAIGTNGFTVVMSCADEIVGSASVKDWKPTAQENDWKPAGNYVGKSADEASAMDSEPSVRETAICEGDVEVFMVAVKHGLQQRKKGIAQGLLQKFCPKENQVRVILRVVKKSNSRYWLKKRYQIVGEHSCPTLA